MNLRPLDSNGRRRWRTEARAALVRYLATIGETELASRLQARTHRKVTRQNVWNWAHGVSRPRWSMAVALREEANIALEDWARPPRKRTTASTSSFYESSSKLSSVATKHAPSALPAPLVAALAAYAGGRPIVEAAVDVVSELQLAGEMTGAESATKPPRVA